MLSGSDQTKVCMEVRGMVDASLVEGARRGSMESLSAWTE